MREKYLEDCPYYVTDFLTYLTVVKDRGPRTEEAYYIDIRTFLRYLKIKHKMVGPNTEWGDIRIGDSPIELLERFTLNDAYVYLKWLKDVRHNETATRARKTTAIKEMYAYLCDKQKIIKDNPLSDLDMPQVKHKLPKYLTLEQSKQLVSSVDSDFFERDYCIITLFLNCGMRLSELCGIDIPDISFENETLRLLGKGNKERIVYLNPACIDALTAYLDIRKTIDSPTQALFLSKRKIRISKRRVQQIVEESLDKAGLGNIGVSTHKLRHTAASLMYQHGGVDTLVLKDILGHKSIATTEIYTHISNESLKDAANSMPDLSDKKPD